MNNITPGQKVAVQSGYGHGRISFGFTVVKVTPKGQVVVKRDEPTTLGVSREYRFDADGYEMNSSSSRYYRDRLVVDVDGATERINKEQRTHAAAAAVNAVRGDAGRYNDKESLLKQLDELATALEAARVAVDAI